MTVRPLIGFLICAAGALLSEPASAALVPITYSINQTIGLGSVVGTITTDGTTGNIDDTNILDFTLMLNGVDASATITSAESIVTGSGMDLTASDQNLYFDYGGQDSGFLLFQQDLFLGATYYCDAAPGNFACEPGATVAPGSVGDPSTQIATFSGKQIIGTATGVPTVPLPPAAPMFGAALLTLAAAGYGLKRKAAAV